MDTEREPRTVELVQAFMWTCEDCGLDQFERAITVSPESIEGSDMEELAQLAVAEANESALALGIEVGGTYVSIPNVVKCRNCGSEFSTEEPE